MRESDSLVRQYYARYDEWGRLVQDDTQTLEFWTTLHFLKKYLPRSGRILDAGGGPGRYTIELARWGYNVLLLDLTPELLAIAQDQVRKARVQRGVLGVVQGSIEDLSRFEDRSFDAVLCLGGSLNHVRSLARRERSLDELVRVAKKGAPIFISVIGRLGVLESGLVKSPNEIDETPELYRRILRNGDYDGKVGFAPCHFYLLPELERSVRKRRVRILEQVGLEGLASLHAREQDILLKQGRRAWENWKSLHLECCTDPAVVATSAHFMIVCRKS
jgi:SAM-dependent methyltransferase